MSNHSISGDVLSNSNPDILSLVNKEKFRRKLLISSRLIAIALIIVLIFFSYQYRQVGEAYKNKPCWSCGYYYGKKCDYFVVSSITYNQSAKEELLKSIAAYNELPFNSTEYNKQAYNSNSPETKWLQNLTLKN
jgi:hypothetical protein